MRIKKLSENKESVSDNKVSRRSMLKWTGALAAAAVAGIGAGYETNQLLRPITEFTQTTTQSVPVAEEQVLVTTTTGGPLFVHVRNGKITWIEPFEYPASEAQPWTITAGGKSFTPQRRIPLAQNAMSFRRKVYAADRMRYPMKRVGFVPGGKGDVSNRGKGEFVRITWQEAFDTIANEMKRIKGTYGNSAICEWGSAHKDWGSFQYGPAFDRFFCLNGGFVERMSDGNSWSGWMYGAPFIWGFEWAQGEGDQDDLLADTLQNSKMVIFWGTDPRTVEIMYRGHDPANWNFWMKQVGIKMVSINPLYGDTAALYCDQWIPIIQSTDTAMALAIANVWIKEGTYDKQYVVAHTIGFDKFSDYVLGKAPGVDGVIDRTPDWASKITGIDAQTITNLAREWASKPTSLVAYNSGACRTAYAHEWARALITLIAMQGLGKPGVSIWSSTTGAPSDNVRQKPPPGYSISFTSVAASNPPNLVKQKVQYFNFPAAILTDFTKNPPLTWKGGTWIHVGPQEIFQPWTYPMPGNSEIKMVWRYGASVFGGTARGHTYGKAYQSPKIELFVLETIYVDEPEAMFADIILPANTEFERNDLTEVAAARGPGELSNRIVVYQRALIDSLYESKTDWAILTEIADRLGFADKFTEGNTEDMWLEKMYKTSSVPLSWEAFKAKGYYIFQLPSDYTPNTAFRWFYQKTGDSITGPSNGLNTPSGKIEIYSKVLADQYGENSNAIGAVPHYFPDPEGRSSPLMAKYPLQVNTAHIKFRLHGQWGNVPWMLDLYKYKGYEPMWINPADASARGIKEQDVVRIFNDRGQILCYAHLTERIVKGVVRVAEGSWYKPATPGNVDSIDTGGNVNCLTSNEGMSPHAYVAGFNSTLAQVEKWVG